MAGFYKFLKIFRILGLIILLIVAFYYSFLKDYFAESDLSKMNTYILPVNSIVYDANEKEIFNFFDTEFRIYTRPDDVPDWFYKIITSDEFLKKYHRNFILKNSVYSNSAIDCYKNYYISKVNNFSNSLLDKLKIYKIRNIFFDGNSKIKSIVLNQVPFSKRVFGIATIAKLIWHKPLTDLSNEEYLYLIAMIDFYSISDNFNFENSNELFFELYDFIKEYYPDVELKERKLPVIKEYFPDLKKINQDISKMNAGISYPMMEYYLNDFIVDKKTKYNIVSNGVKLYTPYDIEYLEKILKILNIKGGEDSNKLAVIYYFNGKEYYMIGILNLPFGKQYSDKIFELRDTLEYKNNKINILIEPIVRFSYVEMWSEHKSDIIPLLYIK